jgi:hypothetical protein
MGRTEQKKKVSGASSGARKQPIAGKPIPPKRTLPDKAAIRRRYPQSELRIRRRILSHAAQNNPPETFREAPFRRYVKLHISNELKNGVYGVGDEGLKTQKKIYKLLRDATVGVLSNLLESGVVIASAGNLATVRERHLRAARHVRNVPWDVNMGSETAITWFTSDEAGTFGSSKPKKKKRVSRAKAAPLKNGSSTSTRSKAPPKKKAPVERKVAPPAKKKPVVKREKVSLNSEYDEDELKPGDLELSDDDSFSSDDDLGVPSGDDDDDDDVSDDDVSDGGSSSGDDFVLE